MENNIQIFNSPVFGDIRTMMINGEPWFVGKDVAEALQYNEPRKAIQRHVSEDDGMKRPVIDALGRTQESILINESGLYSLIFGSKLDSAKKFKKWVTSEVLPTIRKTGGYTAPMTIPEQIQLLAMGNVELNQRVDTLDKKIENLEYNLPILGIEIDKITAAVKKKGVDCLGGKDSNAYQDRSLRSKIYNDIYRELKRQFGVSTYKAIKRSQCDTAVGIINEYQLPYVLTEQVQYKNSQVNLW